MRRAADTTTPRARALSAAIRQARQQAGLSGRELSARLGLSHGTISHWETGRRVPSPIDVASLLTAARITGEQKRAIIDLARNAADPNWLTAGLPGIPQQLSGAIECERAATSITEWALSIVPGLLQTADYARAIIEGANLPVQEVDKRVMLRLGRREIITRRRNPVQFHALIGEAALQESIGGAEVMTDQLDFLLEIAHRKNVDLRVMPSRCGWHPGLSGPFVLYEFDETAPVLHFEHYSSGAFIPDVYDVQTYRTAIDTIREKALDREESVNFIGQIAKRMEYNGDRDRVAEIESYRT